MLMERIEIPAEAARAKPKPRALKLFAVEAFPSGRRLLWVPWLAGRRAGSWSLG